MKKKLFFSLLCSLILLSCNNNKVIETHDFAEEVIGDYEFVSATLTDPFDLNFDGEFNTDLTKEITCNFGPYEYSFDSNLKVYWLNEQVKENNLLIVPLKTFYTYYDHGHQEQMYPGCYDMRTIMRSWYIHEDERRIEMVRHDDDLKINYTSEDCMWGYQIIGYCESAEYENGYLTITWSKKFPRSAEDHPNDYERTTLIHVYKKIMK